MGMDQAFLDKQKKTEVGIHVDPGGKDSISPL